MQPQRAKRKGVPFYEDKTAMFVAPLLGAFAVCWGIYTAQTAGNRADEAEAQVRTLTVQARDAQNEASTAADRGTKLSAQLDALRKTHSQELAAQRERLQRGFDDRLARERASWQRQLDEARAKAAAPAPLDPPENLAVSDSLATEDERSGATSTKGDDAKWAFQRRCLQAVAADLGVDNVNQTSGGMLSARPWGPPAAGLWFWKPMIRVSNTEHTEIYTCRTSNDQGFEVFPGL